MDHTGAVKTKRVVLNLVLERVNSMRDKRCTEVLTSLYRIDLRFVPIIIMSIVLFLFFPFHFYSAISLLNESELRLSPFRCHFIKHVIYFQIKLINRQVVPPPPPLVHLDGIIQTGYHISSVVGDCSSDIRTVEASLHRFNSQRFLLRKYNIEEQLY